MVDELKAAVAGLLLTGAAQSEAPLRNGSFPVVELRQYTLRQGQRDVLIELFERQFIEGQEAVGIKVIGTFTDLDRPDRFVWLRGFRDMESRASGLAAFYGGPVWQANRSAANATMIDSDNVLLLRAPIAPESRGPGPDGLIVATIHYLKSPADDAAGLFDARVKPQLESAGVSPVAWYVSETAPNNFPRLPVREGERVLVWLARFTGVAEHAAARAAIDRATLPLAPVVDRPPEVLRLQPTSRSELR